MADYSRDFAALGSENKRESGVGRDRKSEQKTDLKKMVDMLDQSKEKLVFAEQMTQTSQILQDMESSVEE